jgi:RNA polymerase sigma-70 factor (ECF subfamily)
MDHPELLERCRRGDQLAWEALVRQYQGRVYSLAWHYVRNQEEARDVAQEAFVRIYNKLSSFKDSEMFLPWMLRLTRNVCIDHLRRAKARPPADDVAIDAGIEMTDTRPTPEREAEASSQRRLLHRALDRISAPYREMILLKEIQGLPLEEIASMLDLPLGTVKSRSNRARLELARAVSVIRAAAP